MDRGEGRRQTLCGGGRESIPMGTITAPANRHDSPLLEATLDTLKTLGELPDRASVHLESAYDSATTRCGLAARWLVGEISQKGKPAAFKAGLR